eukprot:scaffold1439_cov404-Prasinococcus_capsulatus_cf.AAC.40
MRREAIAAGALPQPPRVGGPYIQAGPFRRARAARGLRPGWTGPHVATGAPSSRSRPLRVTIGELAGDGPRTKARYS